MVLYESVICLRSHRLTGQRGLELVRYGPLYGSVREAGFKSLGTVPKNPGQF